jgi:Zn-dependent protease
VSVGLINLNLRDPKVAGSNPASAMKVWISGIKMKFSRIELHDLLKAWIAISIAFAIVLSGSIFSLSFFLQLSSLKFFLTFLLAALTVGIGFLLHELGHKLLAQKYGCKAEFRSFDNMLLLAVVMSFFGFVFAAPGAVMISGHINQEKNGKVSSMGPIMNIVLALFFLLLLNLVSFISALLIGNYGYTINSLAGFNYYITLLARYGYTINSWIALFNMIPFWAFDGKKILAWNKIAYFLIVLASIALIRKIYKF